MYIDYRYVQIVGNIVNTYKKKVENKRWINKTQYLYTNIGSQVVPVHFEHLLTTYDVLYNIFRTYLYDDNTLVHEIPAQ